MLVLAPSGRGGRCYMSDVISNESKHPQSTGWVLWNDENPLLEWFKFYQILCPANSLSPRARIRWWCDDTIVVLQRAGD